MLAKEKMKKKLTARLTITENPSEVFCIQYSPDGIMLAAGCDDGAIRVFNSEDGRLQYTLKPNTISAMPLTALRFRPHSAKSKTKNVLLAVNADGAVQHWHITSGRCLNEIIHKENPLFCVDYRSDAEMFAAAGKDYGVYLYDEATKTQISKFDGGPVTRFNRGHSNRVFSLKFNPDDDNLLVSGGWDNTVQIWDIRTGRSVRSIYGPHICGDSVDVKNGIVLTGSWRTKNQLEMWDLNSGKLIEEVKWNQGGSGITGDACQLYSAKFNSNGSLIGAGGSGSNEAKVFDCARGNVTVGTIAGLKRGVFTMDWSSQDMLAVAGGDHAIRVYEVEDILDTNERSSEEKKE